MGEPTLSISGIVIRKDTNSKSDGILKVLGETLDKSVTGFCVENDGGFFLVFECSSRDFANVLLRSIFNVFRRNAESRVVFTIDDTNKKLFSEFQVLIESSEEDQHEENSGDSEVDIEDVASDIYSRVENISKSIVDAKLKDVKESKPSLFLSYEDIVSISKIDGLIRVDELVKFTSESIPTALPSDSCWPAFPSK